MTLDEFNALPEASELKACRILPSEVDQHPELGLTIAADAFWKPTAIAPDAEAAFRLSRTRQTQVDEFFARNLGAAAEKTMIPTTYTTKMLSINPDDTTSIPPNMASSVTQIDAAASEWEPKQDG